MLYSKKKEVKMNEEEYIFKMKNFYKSAPAILGYIAIFVTFVLPLMIFAFGL
jgi:hypothetical protein